MPTVALNKIYPSFSHEFLNPFMGMIDTDIKSGIQFNVRIRENPRNKLNPILKLARPEDAKFITEIVKEDYEGSYPYKEMEDEKEIQKMIKSGKYKFILFLDKSGEVLGSTCFGLDFEEKKGYLRSLVVKKKCLGVLDATKAYIGSCIVIWQMFRDKILIWWGEARTADAKSQYINRLCSLRQVAFLPNKDLFYNKIESDIVMISYNEKVLREYRSTKTPQIIPEILKCYSYSDDVYDLGYAKVSFPVINLDYEKLVTYKENLTVKISRDKFGYETIKFNLKNSKSFFEFLHTPRVKNFEKTNYKVNNLEELAVFIQEYKKCARKFGIRYIEAHVSAYNPSYQKIFLDMGLIPRGYIPSWKHHNGIFEDYVLFNHYEGEIDKSMELLEEGWELLKYLNNQP
jgi:hypothetical protein